MNVAVPPGRARIAASVVAAVAAQIRHWGEDPAQILAASGLDPQAHYDADARVPLAAFTNLLEAANEKFPRAGLRLAAALGSEALGFLGALMQGAETTRAALRVLERYIATFQDSTIQQVKLSFDGAAFVYQIMDDQIVRRAQDAEFSIGIVFNILRSLGAERPFEVMFEHAPIGRWRDYDSYFDCPVYFNQPYNALVFTHEALDAKLTPHEGDVRALAERLDALLSQRRDNATAVVASLIQTSTLEAGLRFDGLARALGVSPSTLSRKLAREGVRYRAILHQRKRELAERLLAASSLSVAEIALQLGYAENATFSRSFLRWTGMSPRQYRKLMTQQNAGAKVLSR